MSQKKKLPVKKKKPEQDLQKACVAWFKMQYPKEIIMHIPNGGKMPIGQAMNLKRAGLLAGVPDLFIPTAKKGYNGYFIELKVGKNKPSEEQNNIIGHLRLNGYATDVIYDFETFMLNVKNYLSNSGYFVV